RLCVSPPTPPSRCSPPDEGAGAMNDVAAVYPEILVTVVAVVVLMADATLERRLAALLLPVITIAGLVAALASVFYVVPAGQYFRGFVTIDAFTSFFPPVLASCTGWRGSRASPSRPTSRRSPASLPRKAWRMARPSWPWVW